MQVAPQITFRGMIPSPAVEARITERIEKLEQFHSRLTSCRVVVEAPHRRGNKGQIYNVSIDVRAPGGEVVVNREAGLDHAHEDIYVAIRDAFNAAQRQLEDHVRKHSGFRTKEHPPTHHGSVVRIFAEKGYGFIEAGDGRELFFQRDNLTGSGWDKIDIGSQVRFTEIDDEAGLRAVAVTVAD